MVVELVRLIWHGVLEDKFSTVVTVKSALSHVWLVKR